MSNNNEIITEAKRRNIQSLFHYSKAKNLESILINGLKSRENCERTGKECSPNDLERWDGRLNSVSLSVSFPNYKLFYTNRENNNEDWIVIELDAIKILQDFDCMFCAVNAASKKVKQLTDNDLKSPKAFIDMFSEQETPNNYTRSLMDLDENETTNPQAEILVSVDDSNAFHSINAIEYFTKIYFNNVNTYKKYIDKIQKYAGDNIKVEVNDYYFRPRHDYDPWR